MKFLIFLLCLAPALAGALDTVSLVNPQSQVDNDAGGVDYLVARYGAGIGVVTVDIQLTPTNATLGVDYQAPQPTTLTWADGDLAPQVVHLPILYNATWAPERYLTLSLVNVTGAMLDPSSSAVLLYIYNINPNPSGLLTLIGASQWGAVGVRDDSGTLSLSVTRSGGSLGAESVTFVLNDQTTQLGVDYAAPASLTLSWMNGESGTKQLGIPILPRTQALGPRILDVSWSTAGGGADIDGQGWMVTITDHLPATAGTIQVPASLAVLETAGTADISVLRQGGSSGAVSVQWSIVDDTTTLGVNYLGPTSGTLSWADGDSSAKTLVIPVLDDGVPEPTLDAFITFSSPTGGLIVPIANTTILDILDNDDEGLFGFTMTGMTVQETVGIVKMTVTRSGGSTGAVSVDWTTSDATALAGTDYAATSGTLSWADGDTSSRQISVTILNGSTVLPNRWFYVNLQNPLGGAGIDGNNAWVTVTILNANGGAPDTISLQSSQVLVERSAGSVSAVLTRSGSGIGPAGIQIILAPGSAQLGLQYGPPSTSVVAWNAGETGPKTLTIPIIDDGATDVLESFTIQLGVAYGNCAQSPTATVSETVMIDDPPNLVISPTGTTTDADPISFTLAFSHAVSGLGTSSITVGDGSIASLTGSGQTYQVQVIPAADGVVSVGVAAGAALDSIGFTSTAASASVTSLRTPPSLVITPSASATSANPIIFTLIFSDNVTGLSTTSITVGDGNIASLAGSGKTYQLQVTPSADGIVSVAVAAGAAQDIAGNNSLAASAVVTSLRTPPSLVITPSGTTTTTTPIAFTLTFSNAVSGLSTSAITVGNGTIASLSGSGVTYQLQVIPTTAGLISVAVAAGAGQDAAGNASTAGSATVTFAVNPTGSTSASPGGRSCGFGSGIGALVGLLSLMLMWRRFIERV